jgi:hypothetical protein
MERTARPARQSRTLGAGSWELTLVTPVSRHLLKPALKRGALVAAANWPVVIIQAVVDALFKALIAMPLIGGIFLVALVIGAEPGILMSLAWRDLIATIVASLASRPLVLVAFLASLGIVVVGGSLFVFLFKAGTVGILVCGERAAGPIELTALHLSAVSRAATFSLEAFEECARSLYPRYARLGAVLGAVYVASGVGYMMAVFASRTAGESWAMTALFTGAFVAWITIVNLIYLLMQIVIAVEDCGVSAAATRVGAFLRRERNAVVAVFGIVLLLVIFAEGASLLVMAALGLIGFVPVIGLTVWPLQFVAWLVRALVFQYIGLSSVGAYLKLYRGVSAAANRPLFADADLRGADLNVRPSTR